MFARERWWKERVALTGINTSPEKKVVFNRIIIVTGNNKQRCLFSLVVTLKLGGRFRTSSLTQ